MMRIAAGGQVRTTTGLNIRSQPVVADGNIVAVAAAGAILHPVADPAAGWVQVELRGWTGDGRVVQFEPMPLTAGTETKGKLTKAAPGSGWRRLTVTGFVSAQYLTVIDGPNN